MKTNIRLSAPAGGFLNLDIFFSVHNYFYPFANLKELYIFYSLSCGHLHSPMVMILFLL